MQFRAKASLQVCRRVTYESGNKCGRLLANSLREQTMANYIPHITLPSGQKVSHPRKIASSFREFYSSLYNLQTPSTPPLQMDDYLRRSNMPKLPAESSELLAEPIAIEEIQKAVASMKVGKAPGPDGFTAQYYKTLLPALGENMQGFFSSLGSGSHIPRDTLIAHITVIPKEGKDVSACGSYRPISLLNLDLKIFMKILSTRIQTYLPSLIHLDQVGFVPTREARDNTIKVLNILHVVNQNKTPCIFLSMDAEKAFDRVNWNFMTSVLRHIGLGGRMLNWISSVYADPTARVRVNGVLSDPFLIRNGTRQGCPLSPLLFALSLEPFLRTVHAHPDITGVTMGETQQKIAAYADDMMFTLTNPVVSVPNLLQEFRTYGNFSNMKINFNKSVAMGLGIHPRTLTTIKDSFNFKWTTTAIKYLGTYVPPKMSQLFDLNFPPLLSTVRTLLTKWNKGLHSWFGRCNILKMCILPTFLYLLQALPIHIPPHYFNQTSALFSNFIWANKRPRLNKRLITLPKIFGGLAVPDLRKYQQATHLTRLIDWIRHKHTKLWTLLEQTQSIIPLNRLPWCHNSLPRMLKNHPLIGVTSRICASLFTHAKLTSCNSPLRPILGTPDFTPGYLDPVFRSLRERGYSQSSHFSANGRWPTVEELMNPVGQYCLDFWRALQLKHYLSTLPAPEGTEQTLMTFEALCTEEGTLPHALSVTYHLLTTPPENHQIPALGAWERDMQCTFSPRQKQNIIIFTFKSSICTKIQETNFKILSRWYNTPTKLQRFFPSTSGLCWRCGGDRGTILHIFWDCPLLGQFWRIIQQTIQNFTERPIKLDPGFFLLHATDMSSKKYKNSLLKHLLDAAKSYIPLLLKSIKPPTTGMWIRKVEDIREMEDLILTARHKSELYSKIWSPWLIFIFSNEGQTLLKSDCSHSPVSV